MSGRALEDLRAWRELAAAGVDDALAGLAGPPGPKDIAHLRARFGEEVARLALELHGAREKLARKEHGPLLATQEAAEQASSLAAARHKAARFRALAPRRIVDLCSGIGGDGVALREAAPLISIDRSPVHAWMAARNTARPAACADVTRLRLRGEVTHLDPSRRAGGKRLHAYEDYVPGPAFIESHLAASPDTAVKLGPGVDLEALPLEGCEVEILSEGRGLTQAILWSGALARSPGLRTATRLPGASSFTSAPAPEPLGDLADIILEADAAIERAGLLGALAERVDAWGFQPGLGLLTARDAPDSPWVSAFRVHHAGPWSERRVKAWLRAHDAGIVEVKTRGGAADADRLQRALRQKGSVPYVVFALRLGERPVGIIAERVR